MKRKSVKISIGVFLVLFVIGSIFCAWLIATENAIDMDAIKESLYKKEEAFESDFNLDTKLTDCEIVIKNNQMEVNIYENMCGLRITYDENKNVLEKEFCDYRNTKSPVLTVILCVVIAVLLPVFISALIFICITFPNKNNNKGDYNEKKINKCTSK